MDARTWREATQRLGPAAGIPGLLAECGIEPAAALDPLGLTPADLAPDTVLPFAAALDLLARCAEVTGRADFGLMLGARFDHRALGLVGEAMASAATLGDGLVLYTTLQVGLSQGWCSYLIPSGECTALGFGIYDRYRPGGHQIYDVGVAVACNAIAAMTGGAVAPHEVHLCHRPAGPARTYERALRAPVRFDQEQTCLVLSADQMARPLPGADAARHAHLVGLAYGRLGHEDMPLATRLRHMLRPMIAQGAVSLEAAAARLGLHPRTLNRRLMAEGTSYVAQRNAVRYAVASELLAMTDLGVGEIALALGYATQSAFTHAFQAWSGHPPSRWRDLMNAAQAR